MANPKNIFRTVLKYRSGSLDCSANVMDFPNIDFTDCTIISGEDYYIDKALNFGAAKAKRARKANSE